jgi:uncharacterized protein
VVNLVGDPIFAKRWTQTRKQELIQTRVLATRSLVEGIRKAGGQGRILISSTAIEYAGNTGDRQVDEMAGAGIGFLAELSQLWEAEAQRVSETSARLVLLRRAWSWDAKAACWLDSCPCIAVALAAPLVPEDNGFPGFMSTMPHA